MSANVNLNNIRARLTFGGLLDIGLDAIAQALRDGIRADVGLSNVKADVGLSNIRADANIGLNDIRLRELPIVRVEASIKELPLIRSDSKVDLGLDNIRIQELPPIQLELAIRPTRVHLPLSYSFGIELFGFRLFKLSLCGEGMVITEDYEARETERC
jgi:hypothetical protein